jgi:hypothetical protein
MARKVENTTSQAMKQWWIDRMITAEFPLQEKNDITVAQSLVATLQK